MTTCVFSKPDKVVAADSQGTDSAGHKWRVNKIERITRGRTFLGSGHSRTIEQAKLWASKCDKSGRPFSPKQEPDWGYFLDDPEDRDFQVIVIDKDGERVWLLDSELTPMEVQGEFFAVGSGAAYALGALEAGASPAQAVAIAAKYDQFTSFPISVGPLGGPLHVEA